MTKKPTQRRQRAPRTTGGAMLGNRRPGEKSKPVERELEDEFKLDEKTQAELDEKTKEERQRIGELCQDAPTVRRRRVYRELEDSKKKKSTKKEQEVIADWRGKNAGRHADAMFRALQAVGRKQYGHSAVAIAGEMESLTVGIPVPLAMELLIQQDVFPLGGVIISLVGPSGALKTSLGYEFARWFRDARGGSINFRNESKESPDLPQSIMGYGREGLLFHRTKSLEDWQNGVTYWNQNLQKMFLGTQKEPGPGRSVPMLFTVDSIMGKLSRESADKILAAGFADRAHPVEALKMTRYMQFIPQQMEDWPFALLLINQLKDSEREGIRVRGLAGGKQVQFQETFQIESKIINSMIECRDKDRGGPWKGKVAELRVYRNAQGDEGQRLPIRMLWWHEKDEETGVKRQKTVFDWDWSLVAYLARLRGEELDAVKSVAQFEIHCTGHATNSISSKTLGISKENPVSWTEFGRMFRETPELVDGLRDVLNIKPRGLLVDTVPFDKQREKEVQKIRV